MLIVAHPGEPTIGICDKCGEVVDLEQTAQCYNCKAVYKNEHDHIKLRLEVEHYDPTTQRNLHYSRTG
jgi:hypothetical protein